MARKDQWEPKQIPDQSGRTFVITGANSGIGFEAARALAGRGARLIMACRSTERAEAALRSITDEHPSAEVEVAALDLADLASIKRFADDLAEDHEHIDVLINNAGVMALPQRATADGFEMQLGTNHLGHFALTGRLIEQLARAPQGARVVTVSSMAHRFAKPIDFDDLQMERSYTPWGAYARSKLANLYFAFELDRRARAAQIPIASLACHPGWAATNLQSGAARMKGSKLGALASQAANALFAQSAAMGALPTLRAATDPDASGRDYFGPSAWMEWRGHPARVSTTRLAQDAEAAARLWDESERLTGVTYEALTPARDAG